MKIISDWFIRAGLFPVLFFIATIFSTAQAKPNLPEVKPGEMAPVDSIFDEPLSKGLVYVFSDRYEEAVALFDSLQQVFPDHPAPYFYQAAAYQCWMSSYRFNKFQKELEENVQKAIDIGNKLMEKDDDPWLNFHVGAAYGYRAFYRFRKHDWIGAYFDGKKGIGNLEKALDKMPNLYDCYLGLGSYYYWRTAKSKFLRIITFWMKDRRKLGLKQIQLSVEHGRYCTEEATYGLIIAHYDYKQFDEAMRLNDKAQKFHGAPSMAALYMRGRLMAHYQRWPEVETIYRELLSRLIDHPYKSVGYQVECKYWIAEALKALDKPEEAYELTVEARSQSLKRNKESEQENPIDNFDEIKKQLDKLHDSLQKELGK